MVELAVVIVLFALLLALGGGLLWQERRRPPQPQQAVVYGADDAEAYVWERLPDHLRAQMRRSDVRRILEWELHYLQQPKLRRDAAVVGSTEAARYVQERAFEVGYSYEPEPIFAVLDLQAAYLAEIGAVADRADEAEGQR